jgi:hypothetical protein
MSQGTINAPNSSAATFLRDALALRYHFTFHLQAVKHARRTSAKPAFAAGSGLTVK